MKTLLIVTTGVLLAGSAFAANDSNFRTTNVRRNTVPPVNNAPTVEGGIQRAARVGNPAQAVNPVAPQQYGDGHEFVTVRDENLGARQHDPYKATPAGLRLFSISF